MFSTEYKNIYPFVMIDFRCSFYIWECGGILHYVYIMVLPALNLFASCFTGFNSHISSPFSSSSPFLDLVAPGVPP